LETHVLSVAKIKLSDFLQDYRRLAVNKGESAKGEVIIGILKKEIENDHNNKPRTKLYKEEVLRRRGSCASTMNFMPPRVPRG
jgi:hypothetical protein